RAAAPGRGGAWGGGGWGGSPPPRPPPRGKEGGGGGGGRILPRPGVAGGDVGHPAALGFSPAMIDDRLGDRGRARGFGGGQEPGPEQRPGGSQGQRGGDTAAVGDPAGGQYRRGSGQGRHHPHEPPRGPSAAM